MAEEKAEAHAAVVEEDTYRVRARRITVVILCVYLSVTTKSATYLTCTSKVRCHRVLYDVFNHAAFAENASFKSSGIIC